MVWDDLADSTLLFRYAIHTTIGTDTLESIVAPEPIVVGDTSVMGLILADDNEGRRGFWVDHDKGHRELFTFVPGRPLRRQPVPTDVFWIFNDIVPSPDGRLLAYVAEDSAVGTFAAVRDLRTGKMVARGNGGGGCECDVDMNHARWITADSFEIAVARGDGWQIVSGRAGTRRVHTDIVAVEPEWH
jgi:hypothetical protein